MAEKREPYSPLLKSYPDSVKINSVSEKAENLFTRLIAQADDADHYYGEAAMVLGKLFTQRMCNGEVDLASVQDRIDELANARLIGIYVADGRRYIEILNRRNELRIDRKHDLRFPKRVGELSVPDTARIRDGKEPDTVSYSTRPDSTRPDPKPLPAVAGANDLPPGFVEFWKNWPRHFRKQGRKNCLKLWKTHKLEAISARVVEVLLRFKTSFDWTKDDGQWIPFPMTWLNRTPWETADEDMPDIDVKPQLRKTARQAEREEYDKAIDAL